MLFVSSMFFLFFLCSSCDEEGNGDCFEISYGQIFTAEVGDKFCLPDGSEVKIEQLNNMLCPCNVMCSWEGEIVAQLTFTFNEEILEYEYHAEVDDWNAELPNDLLIQDHAFELESECTEANPSPKVKSVDLEIRKI